MNAHATFETAPPPHSIEAEQQLLGAVMLANDAWYACEGLVEGEHFYEPTHQRLWEIMADRIGNGGTISPQTLTALLGADGAVDLAGITIAEYIKRLAFDAATIRHAPDHAKVIRNLWARRRLIALTRYLQGEAMGAGGIDVEALLEEADTELGAIRFGKGVAGMASIGELAEKSLAMTAKAFEMGGAIGFNTGIAGLDEMIGPMLGGDLVVILAPSGHGKSALGAQILYNNAMPSLDAHLSESPGFYESMEMDGAQIARRQMATNTGISTRAQKEASIVQGQYETLRDTAEKLKKVPIYIDEGGAQKVSTVIRKLRAMKRRHGIKSAVVDHVKLFLPENPRANNIETIGQAAMLLKKAAKDLDMLIILLAQVTRASQTRDGWRVKIGDLYGGETVRENADVVITACLPERWLQENKPEHEKDMAKWLSDIEAWKGYAEIAAPKVRDGESGSPRKIAFHGARMLFSDR